MSKPYSTWSECEEALLRDWPGEAPAVKRLSAPAPESVRVIEAVLDDFAERFERLEKRVEGLETVPRFRAP